MYLIFSWAAEACYHRCQEKKPRVCYLWDLFKFGNLIAVLHMHVNYVHAIFWGQSQDSPSPHNNQ